MSDAADIQRDLELAATDADAATVAARENQKNIHTAIPGIVQSFDPKKQTATVQPAIKRIWTDDGPLDLPVCVDCPVQFPGGGGLFLTFPVSKGDECLLVFSERAIDAWHANGGSQEPSDYRLHDLSDGFALMGFSSIPRAISGLFMGGAELRTLDGQTVVRVEPGMVTAGNPATAAKAARADIMNDIIKLLISHTHPVSGAVAGPSAQLTILPDPSAQNVKIS